MVRTSLMVIAGVVLSSLAAAADSDRDLSTIDRRIGKQPKYLADQPQYGLIVFGSGMKTRLWIALDKSTKSQRSYDVAYVDLNGNGDLTDEGERFTGVVGEDGATRFKFPDFTDAATKQTHTEFSLRCSVPDDPYQMVSVKWNGKLKFGGGYTANPAEDRYSCFESSPEKAPILWLNGDGPFTFQRWYTEPLAIGRETDVKLFTGVPGDGTSTFCAFQVHPLPAGEGIEGILHYTTTEGEQRQNAFALMDKC